jgi:hypothetical protein
MEGERKKKEEGKEVKIVLYTEKRRPEDVLANIFERVVTVLIATRPNGRLYESEQTIMD